MPNISEDYKRCTLGVQKDVRGVPSNRQGLGRWEGDDWRVGGRVSDVLCNGGVYMGGVRRDAGGMPDDRGGHGRWEGGTLVSKGHKKGKGTGTWDGWCRARQGRNSREL